MSYNGCLAIFAGTLVKHNKVPAEIARHLVHDMGYSKCYWIMATSLFFLIERCQPYQSSSFRSDDSVHQNQKMQVS
nr:hypothetical protein [Tanacetum cinerariifolium]